MHGAVHSHTCTLLPHFLSAAFHNSHGVYVCVRVARMQAGRSSITQGGHTPPYPPPHPTACIHLLTPKPYAHTLSPSHTHSNGFQSLPARPTFPGHLEKPAAQVMNRSVRIGCYCLLASPQEFHFSSICVCANVYVS